MKLFVVLAILAVACANRLSDYDYAMHFSSFVARFEKHYEGVELFRRFETFKTNYDTVAEHNEGNHTWTMGLNEFSDMTGEQFYSTLTGPWSESERPQGAVEEVAALGFPNDKFDWRDQGAVTSVKNQGTCGSCWTFSGAGTMEGLLFIKTKALVDLSEQQLLDCAGSYGNRGCGGGLPWSCFDFARDKGICTYQDYPYMGRQGTCKTTCKSRMKTAGYSQIASEAQFQAVLRQNPISLGLDVTNWQHYSGGVFNGPCGQEPQHAVIGVGWQDNAWIIKNSWGTSWGESGFIRLASGRNLCNVGKWGTNPKWGSAQ